MRGNERRKHRPLTEFLRPAEAGEAQRSSQASGAQDREVQERPREAGRSVPSDIDELLSMMSSAGVASRRAKEAEERRQTPIEAVLKALEGLARSPGVRRIECGQDLSCSDGRRVGESFVDELGIPRYRGFLNTTRIPIYLDWILERGKLRKLTKKAYVVETDRGALAVVPPDYLCELQHRYGVLIEGLEGCEERLRLDRRQERK
ncbi:MAG: hypothetical protein ABWK00_06890 [Desulfurococcaceae archaeon]